MIDILPVSSQGKFAEVWTKQEEGLNKRSIQTRKMLLVQMDHKMSVVEALAPGGKQDKLMTSNEEKIG